MPEAMENKDATLEVQTSNATYSLPVSRKSTLTPPPTHVDECCPRAGGDNVCPCREVHWI